jgi:hypothetical protein
MNKCVRTFFVSLLVVLTIGKSALASSKGMTGEKAMYYLKNIKGCINELIVVYNDKNRLAERRHAEKNLEGVVNHPLTRPIVEQAFDDVEKEAIAYGRESEEAKKSWWSDFFAIRKTYLRR